MTISVAITNSANEILDSLPKALDRFQLEPRCRICRNDDMRKKVNDLLAVGRVTRPSCALSKRTTPRWPLATA
jgi:hypothetical protein